MTGTFILELLWTITALSGVVVQSWLLRDALRTRALYRADPRNNGRRGRMIHGHIRAARGFLFVHLTFAYAGVRALSLPDPPLVYERVLTICLFITAAAVLVWIGTRDRADRLWVRAATPRSTDERG